MGVPSSLIRDYIECLGWNAEDAEATFADTLKAARRARFLETSKGKILVGTSSGGTTVTYSLPQSGGFGAHDFSMAGEQIARASELLLAETPDLTDSQLIAALIAHFNTITSLRSNFSTLRMGGAL